MRTMPSKQKWSGAESRKSKRQRELLRSAEVTERLRPTLLVRLVVRSRPRKVRLSLRYLTVTGLIAFIYT